MTVSDTHADTIRRTLVSVGRWAASIDEPTAAVEHGCLDALAALNALVAERDALRTYLDACKEVAADIRAERDRERARADRLADALEPVLIYAECERARADRAEALVERFHEAWWNWNPGDDTEALDAAASEAMCLLGTVIRLNPAALSAGSGGRETT